MLDLKQILKNRPLVISLILALVAIFMMQSYLNQQKQKIAEELEEQKRQVATVFLAKDNIRAGEVIKRDMLKSANMPIRFLQPKTATSLEQIEGRVALVPIEKGEYILLTKLMARGEGENLAQLTPPGKRAVSIVVDSIAGLGGMVRPGDYVDVISIIPIPTMGADGKQVVQATTVTLFQNVLVLAVGGKTDLAEILAEEKKKKSEEKTSPPVFNPIVTLALAPEEANIVSFLQEQQVRLRLALRSPGDATTVPVQPPATWDMVLKYLYPGYTPQMPEEEVTKPPPTIEIQRGPKKEAITSGER
ncbi:MAG: Flp pilus assembly protein CpaB [Candidatus Omnitrophica bacterium]|nr:Flp pilus assembly protein CpaB [Candidatus Omnitrophota bacterium]